MEWGAPARSGLDLSGRLASDLIMGVSDSSGCLSLESYFNGSSLTIRSIWTGFHPITQASKWIAIPRLGFLDATPHASTFLPRKAGRLMQKRRGTRVFRRAISRRGPNANGYLAKTPGPACAGSRTRIGGFGGGTMALTAAIYRALLLAYSSSPVCVSGCSIDNQARPRSFRPGKAVTSKCPK
jgi:hypothetical protein